MTEIGPLHRDATPAPSGTLRTEHDRTKLTLAAASALSGLHGIVSSEYWQRYDARVAA